VPSVAFVSDDFAVVDSRLVPNGCAWYRCVLPGRALGSLGWEVGIGWPAINEDFGVGLAHKDDQGQDRMMVGWDVIVLKLVMHKAVLEAMRAPHQVGRLAVDVDDFHNGLHEDNVAKKTTDPLLEPLRNRSWYEQIIREAEFITVSTEFLADYYSRRVRDVRIVRNGIDADRFPQVDLSEPVLGWVGATPWRSGDIEMLAGWLPGFVKDHGVRVHHSGHIQGDPNDFSARSGVTASTAQMELIEDYPKLFQHFSIGLVPLFPMPFNEAKSYIKGVEYAASGIPFIASPTAEYRLLAEAGIGRLASTPDEWRDHVTELLDPDVRLEEGTRIRRIVREEFDMKVRASQWVTALRG
jgi:glycosyltransferase involved in cell wall biosynthesis